MHKKLSRFRDNFYLYTYPYYLLLLSARKFDER